MVDDGTQRIAAPGGSPPSGSPPSGSPPARGAPGAPPLGAPPPGAPPQGDDQTARDAAAAAAAAAHEANVAALAETIARHHDDMARVAFVVSGDVELAAEAAQSSWTEAWKGMSTPRNPERLRSWLMGVAAKEAKWLSEAGSRAREEAARGDTGVVPATAAATGAAYRSEELDLANIFAELDGHDRQIIGLRYVAGLGSDDIGRELGMPAAAAQARIARVLKRLLDGVKNLQVTGESVADYERALAGRIRAFSTRAVVPLDPEEIARAAIAGAASTVSATDRLGERLEVLVERLKEVPPAWLAGGGALVVFMFAFLFLFRGGGGGGDPLVPTPIPTDATRLCESNELQLRVTAWAPSGPERIASVEMRNAGSVACLVDNLPEPWLVEAPQSPMLIGTDFQSALLRIGPGDVMTTRVRVRNYCGPDPRAPVTLAFRRDTVILVAQPLNAGDLSGVPGCGGYTSTPSDVQMLSPWGY